MNISQEYLERCAADSGFQIGPLEKVTRLGELASHIARHPVLGKSLVLKGGTAPIPSIFESIFSLFDRENLLLISQLILSLKLFGNNTEYYPFCPYICISSPQPFGYLY